jgi:DNA-binding response OmpR family regulator
VLIVDDDRKVLELIEIAYTSHGFRVLTAADGHEALQKALTEHPDLLVLDVRLPKKTGFEVCEMLRRDPDETHLPIILVSASGDTDARLKGFVAGADDFLAKPFSPRELIARSRRLLIRADESRGLRQRVREFERELSRSQDEVKRSLLETRREQRLRDLTTTLAREFHRTLDLDELMRRIVIEAQSHLGVGMAGLLVRDRRSNTLVAGAVRGDGLDRLAGVEFDLDGPLARLLPALGRPAFVRELERLEELGSDLPPLVAARISRVAPLSGSSGLEAMLVVDERLDGFEPPYQDRETLAVLCETAGAALHVARRLALQVDLELELLRTPDESEASFRAEVAGIVDRAARATLLEPRLRDLLAHGVLLGDPSKLGDRGERLALLAAHDPTGRARDLLRLIELSPESARDAEDEWNRAASLLAAAHALAGGRARGLTPIEALLAVRERDGIELDAVSWDALASACRELESLEGLVPPR